MTTPPQALAAAGPRAESAEVPPSPLITNPGARSGKSLDGAWRALVDPYENGYFDYRYQPSERHYGLDEKPSRDNFLVEYDFDRCETLAVPGDWNSQRPELSLYEGTIWYRTRFDVALQPGRRWLLRFGAANYEARVYLNGTAIGRHVGGFTDFEIDVTAQLRAEGNSLVVKVDDARRREGVPTVNTDWFNFGGLTRSVRLIEVPETYIRDYFVQLEKDTLDVIAGWVRLDGPGASGARIQLEIAELGLRRDLSADAEGVARFRIEPSEYRGQLSLWSCESPHRCEVRLSTDLDECRERIGFRCIQTRGADILLNGKPIFLRGISLHEQAPERPGRAHGEADARKLLGWAQELGCNYVRLAHYPHGEATARVADELGLLVWAEVPVYWTILWENPETYENAHNQLTELISRDRNRACVILWSVANETPVSEPRNRFLGALIDSARRQDPTRLLTAALEHRYTDPHTVTLDDPLGGELDVLGCNQYVGWYDGPPEKADTLTWRVAYDKPLVFSELGAGAKAGRHGAADERWTEEFQQQVYERQLAMLARIAVWRGLTPWILADFQSPRRPLPGVQDGWNRKGLISDRGEKKKAFYLLQSFYRRVAEDPTRAALGPATSPRTPHSP